MTIGRDVVLERVGGREGAGEFFTGLTTVYLNVIKIDNATLGTVGYWRALLAKTKEAALGEAVNEPCLLKASEWRTPELAHQKALADLLEYHPGLTVVDLWKPPEKKGPTRDPLALPQGWRCDAPLIRHLDESWGRETARLWQRESVIDLRYEWGRIVALRDQLKREVPSLRLRPLESCLIDCGVVDVLDDEDKIEFRLWGMVTPPEAFYSRPPAWRPWSVAVMTPPPITERETLILQLFVQEIEDPATFPVMPLVAIVDADDWTEGVRPIAPDDLFNHHEKRKREVFEEMIHTLGGLVVGALAYLCAPPEELVQITPAPSRSKRDGKDAKPWTKRLPSIRVLNPHTVRRTRSEHPEGTHASPIHHHRRGGFVTLLSPRYYRSWEDLKNDGSWSAPPFLPATSYRESNFLSGLDEAGRPHVYRQLDNHWQELSVRLTHRRETYVGPREFDDEEGNVYRVLDSQVPEGSS